MMAFLCPAAPAARHVASDPAAPALRRAAISRCETGSGLGYRSINELNELHRDNAALLRRDAFRVGLLLPMCGCAGIWAPSCISSAQVAATELNESGVGVGGRRVELILIDSAHEAETPAAEVMSRMIDVGAIDAIVGMHISSVRHAVSRVVAQRVPYIYTPLYEGGERTKGVFAIGDTPDTQLGPALAYFSAKKNVRSWAMIGNDYVWPRASNAFAKHKIKQLGARVCLERYVPFGVADMQPLVDTLARSGADAVLISLVGQDAIAFNRAFGAADLHRRMLRFSCVIEENALLASGARNLERLYSAASYFGALDTPANNAFRERYHSLHGDGAPMLNALGQSTYEGVRFLAGLLERRPTDWRAHTTATAQCGAYRSVISTFSHPEATGERPIYLARADGVLFDIEKKLT